MVSLYFAVSMITFFGLIGLGTEVGSWYLGKRHAQNAADAAAWAGTLMVAHAATSAQAITGATAQATANGFTTGGGVTVTVHNPPTTGPNAANNSAVEVIIQQTQTPILAGLFASSMTIQNRAVAVFGGGLSACALALGPPGITVSGSGSIDAAGCVIASNSTCIANNNPVGGGCSGPAVNLSGGSSSITAGSIVSAGGCLANNNPCTGSSQVHLADPPMTNQAVTTDPTAAAQAAVTPTTGSALTCRAWSTTPTTSLTYAGGGKICSNVSINSAVHLIPGTYIFVNANLAVNGSGTLDCPTCSPGVAGMTLIFTGSSIPSHPLTISGTVVLNAPPTSDFSSPALDGVLFFVDETASHNDQVAISGGSSTHLTGGLFFPSVEVDYTGSATSGVSACTELVGYKLVISGSAQFSLTNCAADHPPTGQTLAGAVPRLAE
jgi:hypothetical protein